jgi:hypothetical protein
MTIAAAKLFAGSTGDGSLNVIFSTRVELTSLIWRITGKVGVFGKGLKESVASCVVE